MNSEIKTDKCIYFCEGCEEYTEKLDNWGTNGIKLCESCNEKYDNTTSSIDV